MKDDPTLTPQLLLQAYQVGLFPMSESRNDPEIFWVDPTQRGILPLDGFRISRSLARRMRRAEYTISFDTAFSEVMQGCAARPETWINDTIFALYQSLFAQGQAHSVEVWHDDKLVGGVYGVAIGAAFFGESMFSSATDASKIALAYLIDRLRLGGYVLFDTQFITAHLASLGGVEIPREKYHEMLASATAKAADFAAAGAVPSGQDVIHRNAQTS
jgi:leucyl/phenylalanyl-tRNA--protein transferase